MNEQTYLSLEMVNCETVVLESRKYGSWKGANSSPLDHWSCNWRLKGPHSSTGLKVASLQTTALLFFTVAHNPDIFLWPRCHLVQLSPWPACLSKVVRASLGVWYHVLEVMVRVDVLWLSLTVVQYKSMFWHLTADTYMALVPSTVGVSPLSGALRISLGRI